MARPVNSIPTYRRHKQSGQAVVTVRTAAGKRKDVLLGPWKSQQSREAYNRILAELNSRGEADVAATPTTQLSVNEVLLSFWKHAEQHYRHPDGRPTSELDGFRWALKALKSLYGTTLAVEFGPRRLSAVRDEMIRTGWCRTVINQHCRRIVRVFKWAAAEELVSVTVYQSLKTLTGLRAGRSDAPDREPVAPVPLADFDATLPHLPRVVRAMALLQRFTGMRPGEVCSMKLCEIDRSGPVWQYRPARHKTSYRGRPRVIPIGPKGQGVLLEFLAGLTPSPSGIASMDLANPTARIAAAKLFEEQHRPVDAILLRDLGKRVEYVGGSVLDVTAHIFNPARDREERFAVKRKNRKTRVQPSQKCRRKKNPRRVPHDFYEPAAYANRVFKVCQQLGVPVWSPNRLRHLLATEVRREFGLEAAQVVLGHSSANVTQVYAERDESLALKVAAAVG